jgi:DNA-binding NarL/FixJ family response regulator
MKDSASTFRVAIVDDHVLFANGFRLILKQFHRLQLIGIYCSGEDFLADLPFCQPDLVFMDVQMKGLDGFETTRRARVYDRNIRIIAVTGSDDGYSVHRMLEAGVIAYLTKDTSAGELRTLFEHISQNRLYISQGAVQHYRRYLSGISAHDQLKQVAVSKNDFSDRDLEIMRLVTDGKKAREIADILHISVKTIEAEKKKITGKFGVKKFTETIAQAYKFHILP